MYGKADTVKMNSYINCKTNMKKLQFGTTKCHKMHVGKPSVCCPTITVDSWKIKDTGEIQIDIFEGEVEIEISDEEQYLGDFIASDGTNDKNIETRRLKGYITVDRIVNIMDDVPFGSHHFEVSILLRNSLLLGSMLFNSEAWYGIVKKHIDKLENVETSLFKKVLETPVSTPTVGLYLELGCTPIRFLIKQRRLFFLHYILSQDTNSLIFRFFMAQLENPSKNDWSEQVLKDLEDLNLHLSIDNIKEMSETVFKDKVKKSVKSAAFQYLDNEGSGKSKIKSDEYTCLKTQEYLLSSELTTAEKKFLFQLRTRMICVKNNYKSGQDDLLCPLCQATEDTQEHVLSCPVIARRVKIVSRQDDVKYENIFSSDIKKQAAVTRLFMKLWKVRTNLMDKTVTPVNVTHVI